VTTRGARGGAFLLAGIMLLLTLSSSPVDYRESDRAGDEPVLPRGPEIRPDAPLGTDPPTEDIPHDPAPEPPSLPCGDLDGLPNEESLTALIEEEPDPMSQVTLLSDFSASGPASAPPGYSETNVQVAGVDEPDLVKTDGTYIYTISNGSVVIVMAYPPEDARVVARIPLPDRTYWWGWWEGWWWGWHGYPASPSGIFLHGNRLVVLQQSYFTTVVPWSYNYTDGATGQVRTSTYNITAYHPLTQALVYDVSNPGVPQLYRNVTVSGGFQGARMIGQHVYLVTSEYLYNYPGYPLILPAVWYEGGYYRLYAPDIILPWGLYYPHNLVLLTAFSVEDRDTPESEALLVDSWTQLYVSLHNIYVIGYDGWWWSPWFWDAWWGSWWLGTGNTTIHKYAISRGTFCYVGAGQVPGWPISRWAFDERDEHLRVATETQRFDRWRPAAPQSSNVYVLNATLAPVSALERIAPGEDMTAVRYVGDRAFLVTYGAPAPAVRPSDPLFVIDLSDPTAPSILGELVLPGFSTYLHPFDADHLLGLGRDDCPGSTVNNPWWPRCLKLSLFDVSDLGSPKEVARYIVGEGDRAWSGSEASWDPHAFLFIPSKGLLLIPVEWSSWGSTPQEYRYFEGLFALSVSLDRGFEVVWTDTHLGGPPCPYVESAFSYSYFAYAWRCDIRRALYIGEVAYTVSQALVRMKDLVTGSLLGEVALIEG